jgi:hypothetical protein
MQKTIARFIHEESGQGITEYGAILAFVAVTGSSCLFDYQRGSHKRDLARILGGDWTVKQLVLSRRCRTRLKRSDHGDAPAGALSSKVGRATSSHFSLKRSRKYVTEMRIKSPISV